MSDLWPWLAVGALGLYHGANPAMGWLFAVALGLQEGRRAAVLQALLPIALGHEASVALVVVLAAGVEVAAPGALRLLGAAALVLFGAYKLWRPRSHPRWVGMRVRPAELALWSFLMSTAHGAGLILVPAILALSPPAPALAAHDHGAIPLASGAASLAQGVVAGSLHTLAMLLAMGVVAVLVYEKLGVAVLRRAWLNLDGVWATSLLAAGVLTLFT